jgi:hypothetical protein
MCAAVTLFGLTPNARRADVHIGLRTRFAQIEARTVAPPDIERGDGHLARRSISSCISSLEPGRASAGCLAIDLRSGDRVSRTL